MRFILILSVETLANKVFYRTERKKYGLKAARRALQFSKR